MLNFGPNSKKLARMLGGGGLAQSKPGAEMSTRFLLPLLAKEPLSFQARTKEETSCTTL
jgi:hypothetical protein